LLKEAGESELQEAQSLVKELPPSAPVSQLRRLLRAEEGRHQDLVDGLDLLREATQHETKFAKFANRSYSCARAMEEDDTHDDDLEKVYEAVVASKSKEDRDRRRQESATASAAKPAQRHSNGKPFVASQSRSRPSGAKPSSSGSSHPSATGAKAAYKPTSRVGGNHPCFLCCKTGRWHKDCLNRRDK